MALSGGAVREARGGIVHGASGGEESGRRGRDGGVAETPLEKQKKGERGCVLVYEFLTDARRF